MDLIYLIKSETKLGEVEYKIGFTKRDPMKRIKEFETGNPGVLSLENSFETNHKRLVETALHRLYGTNNTKGEWFELTQEQVDTFIENCEKQETLYTMLKQENTWWQKYK